MVYVIEQKSREEWFDFAPAFLAEMRFADKALSLRRKRLKARRAPLFFS
jgi:hypothetical protein